MSYKGQKYITVKTRPKRSDYVDGVVIQAISFCNREPILPGVRVRMTDYCGGFLCKFPGPDAAGVFQAAKHEVKVIE